MPKRKTYDAVIVGGGPAGLNAALVLGRCRRSVLVLDSGRPRNAASRSMHNYLTRDGINPAKLLQLGRAEIARYGVEFRQALVTRAMPTPSGFRVHIKGDGVIHSRTILLATGVVDELPTIPNVRDFYGLGVYHCPYCDGWEHRDQPLAAYGTGPAALGLAFALRTWSTNITLVTNGQPVSRSISRQAAQYNIPIRPEPITLCLSKGGRDAGTERDRLGSLRFETGPDLKVGALFFNTDKYQRSLLPKTLGCRLNEDGGVIHDKKQRTGVQGLYLAGDACFDVQFVIVAAAEGAKAGVAMNRDMQDWDRGLLPPRDQGVRCRI